MGDEVVMVDEVGWGVWTAAAYERALSFASTETLRSCIVEEGRNGMSFVS